MGQKRDQRKRAKEAAKKTEQHKKNQEAKINSTPGPKFKPKTGELPAKHVMDAIADSVHEAVTRVFDELERAGANTLTTTPNANMKGRCLYYAAAGQYIATAVLGRDYCVQVGSLGCNTDDENMFKIDAANGGVAARRFHMWIRTDDGGFPEYVDFTARFFKDWAVDSGMTWERADMPPYLWGRPEDIREYQGVQFQYEISEEAEADKMVDVSQDLIMRIVDKASAIAERRLMGSSA